MRVSDKPFLPTARRRARAHREGDVPRSAALAGGLALAGFALALPLLVASARAVIDAGLRGAADDRPIDLRPLGPSVAILVAVPALLAVAPFVAAAIVGGISVGRPVAASATPAPPRAWSAGRAIVVIVVTASALAFAVARVAPRVAWRLGDPSRSVAHGLAALELLVAVFAAALTALGVAEAVIVRAAWVERWSMSRAEARDDARASSGDPIVRARARARSRHDPTARA